MDQNFAAVPLQKDLSLLKIYISSSPDLMHFKDRFFQSDPISILLMYYLGVFTIFSPTEIKVKCNLRRGQILNSLSGLGFD